MEKKQVYFIVNGTETTILTDGTEIVADLAKVALEQTDNVQWPIDRYQVIHNDRTLNWNGALFSQGVKEEDVIFLSIKAGVGASPVEGEKEELRKRFEYWQRCNTHLQYLNQDEIDSIFDFFYSEIEARASRIKALEERLEKVTKILNHELAEIPKLQDFASKHGDAQGYARICGQEIILETLKQKFDKLNHRTEWNEMKDYT